MAGQVGGEVRQLFVEEGDVDALEASLDACLRRRQPVLMAVGVLGCTEFGTIVPLDRGPGVGGEIPAEQ